MPFQNSVLGVGSSGGFGHNYVRDQVCAKERAKGKQVLDVDLMKNLVPSLLGEMAVEQWNNAQKTGKIEKQEDLVKKRPIADVVFFLPIFFRTLYTLFSMEKPLEKIVNTQVMGCHAILAALAIYNVIQRQRYPNWKRVHMELWMTDLVSTKATHFLNPLKSLTDYEKSLVTVYIPTDNPADIEYFCNYTGFSRNSVKPLSDGELPVKPIYLNSELSNYTPDTTQRVQLGISLTSEQKSIMVQVPNLRQENRGFNEEYSQYQVLPGDKVYSLMLGSQPTEKVVKAFIDKIIQLKPKPSEHYHVFAFCGRDESGKISLFKKMCKRLSKLNISPNLTIIPLPFQDPKDIAKIMARSNKRFTRAGGATCFEHKAMRFALQKQGHQDSGKVYIVAEKVFSEQQLTQLRAEAPEKRQKLLSKAIPVWEGANAKKLHEWIDATVICMQTLDEALAADFCDVMAEQHSEIKNVANTTDKRIKAVVRRKIKK